MNTIEQYEIKARAFQIMTGEMAPGKDVPSCCYSMSFDERSEMWDKWLKENSECINAMMRAFNDIIEDDSK